MRKGQFIIGDLPSFFFFLVAAAILFFLLFKPLHDHIQDKVVTDNLVTDAGYISLSLPRLPIIVEHGSESQLTDLPLSSYTRFDDVLRAVDLADHHAGDDKKKFMKSREYAVYSEFLDRTFQDKRMWRTADATADHRYVKAYAVVLRHKDKYDYWTCKQYYRDGDDPKAYEFFWKTGLCAPLDGNFAGVKYGSHSYQDPDTGLIVPAFEDYVGLDKVEVGTSYLPGYGDPLMLQVFVMYGVRDE